MRRASMPVNRGRVEFCRSLVIVSALQCTQKVSVPTLADVPVHFYRCRQKMGRCEDVVDRGFLAKMTKNGKHKNSDMDVTLLRSIQTLHLDIANEGK